MKKIIKYLISVLPFISIVGCAQIMPSSNNVLKQEIKESHIEPSQILGEDNSHKQIINAELNSIVVKPILTNKEESNVIVGKPIILDKNVQLISPPTNLPKTEYSVPEVNAKENYVPPPKSKKHGKNKKDKVIQSKSSDKNKKTKSVNIVVKKNISVVKKKHK